MASRVVTQLISDLSGKEINDGDGESIDFSYRGVQYSIDLTGDEAAAFDKAIAKYVDRATRKAGSRRGSTRSDSAANLGGDAKAVRQWAKNQGIEVPDRGRIPHDVRQQYDAAH